MNVPALAALLGLAACPAPRSPVPPSLGVRSAEIGRTGAALTGVAGDGATMFAALTSSAAVASRPAPAGSTAAADPGRATAPAEAAAAAASAPVAITTVEAFRAGAVRPEAAIWRVQLGGAGGPIALTGGHLIAALGGTGDVAGLALRGEPGSVVAALDVATGAVAWKLAIDATEWSVITALAATGDGAVVGGTFSGTLRVGSAVVSSGGKTDGFVARVGAGGVAWLVRVGGPGADTVQGVAAASDRIALTGTFTGTADLLGKPLVPADERSPGASAFVAELDGRGAPRWVDVFGGQADPAIAGVAITARGQIAVAASVRDTVRAGGGELVARGPADGLVAWWGPGGERGPAFLIGGGDFDGLRAIVANGDRVVVGGFYSGSLQLGGSAQTAAGGDDAFLAELDDGGHVLAVWPVSGEGREEVTALAAAPGGFVAGIAHTAAAAVGGDALPAPADPLSGAAIVARAIR